ncbi:MAG: glycosyltransferase family 4 protein [Anaerolineales bacterium]
MNVLLLTQVLPYPPDSGPKIKTWNLLQYLSQRHEVTLVSFTRGDQSTEVAALRAVCQEVYTLPMQRAVWRDALALAHSFVSGQPWTMVRDQRAAMRRLLERLLREKHFDILHADQLNMAQYAALGNGTPRVLDAHNALWVLYRRLAETLPARNPLKWLYARDWQLLKRYEGEICRTFDGVLTVSEEDALALKEAAHTPAHLQVVPIAIDADATPPVQRAPNADHILHIGTMFWPPNVDGILWFLNEVFPLIQKARPAVQCDLVGSRPPAEIQAWDGEHIHVTGYVPDPTPYLQCAGVMIVPLRAGGGMRVKILNALSQELPLVSTTIGAEGIALQDGVHALIADTPEDFAAAVLHLLEDRTLANELGRNGRRLMLEKYDYRRACAPVDDLYRRVAENR